jgi:hypothetical protein
MLHRAIYSKDVHVEGFLLGRISISAVAKAMRYFCHKVDIALILKFYEVAPVNRDALIILLSVNLSHAVRVN